MPFSEVITAVYDNTEVKTIAANLSTKGFIISQ